MSSTLERLLGGQDLSELEAEVLLERLTDGSLSPIVTAAHLVALRAKGETAEEIRGFARAMRRLARRVDIPRVPPALDVVGTGGDGSGSFNLSTAAALLVAACGLPVAKHGNRAVSSRSGSADLLEALGLTLPVDEIDASRLLEETGFTFFFAPYYHPALRTLGPLRRELGIRTIFNIVGPLVNPAAPGYVLLGAYTREVASLLARALSGLPIERAFVVHGTNGWDEATPCGPFLLYDVTPGCVRKTARNPRDYGFSKSSPADLLGGSAEENARRLGRVFAGERGPLRDAVLLGAGLSLELVGRVPDVRTGVEVATAALDDGRASDLLERLRRFRCDTPKDAERVGHESP